MIFKYKIPLNEPDSHYRTMSVYAKIVAAEYVEGELAIWTINDSLDRTRAERKIVVLWTGMRTPTDLDYVDTVVTRPGPLVWHVFAQRPDIFSEV